MPGTGKKFDLSLVTPRAAYEAEVETIIVPGQIGKMGVLAGMRPLIATLKVVDEKDHRRAVPRSVELATGRGSSRCSTTARSRSATPRSRPRNFTSRRAGPAPGRAGRASR